MSNFEKAITEIREYLDGVTEAQDTFSDLRTDIGKIIDQYECEAPARWAAAKAAFKESLES